MIETMTPTELRINQWVMLEQAVIDLQPINSREIWDRFLGWAGTPNRVTAYVGIPA
jgi:hypothetical protein